jgi:CRISPR-associated exonuclease Cas4
MMETGHMPPAIYGNRCKGCSLFKQCVPQAKEKVSKYNEV